MIRDTQAQDTLVAPSSWWRKNRLATTSAVALLAVLGWLGVTGFQAIGVATSVSRDRLSIATVTRGDLRRDVAAEGRVIAAISPTLHAAAAGVVHLTAVAGHPVMKGDVLGTIESPELANRLAQERSGLEALEVDYGRAKLAADQRQLKLKQVLDQARVDLAVARTEHQRNLRGYELGVIPEIDVKRTEAVLEKAKLVWENAQTNDALEKQSREYDVAAARLSRDRQVLVVEELERQVELLSLRAPVSGQVGQLFVVDRASVSKDAALLTVVDLSALEVELKVPESFARDLASGMPAEIRGNGSQWPGVVASVSPEVVAGEVTARVRFDGAVPEGLRQSQRLAVRVVLDHRENVIAVARGPFVETGGGQFVYVVEGDFAQKRSVRVGAISVDRVEVVEGLQPGDQVVISGSDLFQRAERVALSR